MRNDTAEGFLILVCASIVFIGAGIGIALGAGWGLFAIGLVIYSTLWMIPKRQP